MEISGLSSRRFEQQKVKMGVTIQCERTGNNIDLGYGGFAFLREKIAMLAGKEFGEHYSDLSNSKAKK